MEGSVIDLSKYRLERAKDDLKTASDNFKEGSFRASVNRSFSKIVDSAFRLREKADYEDFFVVTIEDARSQIEKAEEIIALVEAYVKTRW